MRPWATVLRAPTTGGDVWMKAAGPATAFEAGLYELLAREAPDEVLAPLALDAPRGWMLLPDGGPPLGERLEGDAQAEAMAAALAQYGRLQRALAPHADALPALGVPDMRPEVMPARFAEALEARARATAAPPPGRRPVRGEPGGALAAVEALRDDVARWCERLAASPVPASLDHNDLHAHNVLGTGPYRFYDWGDAVRRARVRRPARAGAGARRPGARARPRRLPGRVRRPRPASRARSRTAELACRVATIARALTWERALRSAREQGEPVDPRFAHAPYEELTALLGVKRSSIQSTPKRDELGRREEVAGGRADRAGDADAGLERGAWRSPRTRRRGGRGARRGRRRGSCRCRCRCAARRRRRRRRGSRT